MFPRIVIDKSKLIFNAKKMLTETQKRNIVLVGVTKLLAGYKEAVEILVDSGIKIIADSRIQNLIKYNSIEAKKMLLRIPMQSEIEDVIQYSNVCLISEIETIKLLNQQAKKKNKIYNVILMIETGDIREGLLDKKMIFDTANEILNNLDYLNLEGIGTNFACFGGTIPTVNKLNNLVELKKELEKTFETKIKTISCGNSSHITIWNEKELEKDLNQIRSGAALLMGIGFNDDNIPFLKQDVFKLQVEIVEVQTKPSVSWGPKGLDAFGKEKILEDKGLRRKAILAIGRQDVGFENLIAFDKNIEILGQSSDHLICDITDSIQELEVGSIIEFQLNYSAVLSCFTSNYVTNHIE